MRTFWPSSQSRGSVDVETWDTVSPTHRLSAIVHVRRQMNETATKTLWAAPPSTFTQSLGCLVRHKLSLTTGNNNSFMAFPRTIRYQKWSDTLTLSLPLATISHPTALANFY